MRDASNAPDFGFRLTRDGDVSFALGLGRVAISVDDAYELQYQRAEMLAFLETFDDLGEDVPSNDSGPAPNVVAFESRARRRTP